MTERAKIISREELAQKRAKVAALGAAEQEADEIISNARQDAERLRADILSAAKTEAFEKAELVLGKAETSAREELTSLEQDVSELVAETVAKVVGDLDHREAVQAATKTALNGLADHKGAKIRASAEVYRAVFEVVSKESALQVSQDESLQGDRVILSTDRGHSEIGLSDQLTAATDPWREGV